MREGKRVTSIRGGVSLRWLGASTFEIEHAGRVLLLDPFTSRPADARPIRSEAASDALRGDPILVTHGHWDHFADVPDLAARLGATVYLPDPLRTLHALRLRALLRADEAVRWRSWSENRRIELAGLIVQAFPVHREECRGRWLRRAGRLAAAGHRDLRTFANALRLSIWHPLSNAVAVHVTHAATATSVFFFGSLTRQVYGLPDPPLRVDVLALPASQDSDWWIDDATGLISLLKPRVVMVHHHDDWCPPLTRPADVEGFRRAIRDRCDVPVFVPPFATRFALADAIAVALR